MEPRKLSFDFPSLIEGNRYVVDKTLFIRDLLAMKDSVSLFLRPSGWGKTLTLSMVRSYFSCEKGNDPKSLFKGLKIMACGDDVLSKMGQYPVIFLSMKAVSSPVTLYAMEQLKHAVSASFKAHDSIMPQLEDPVQREKFRQYRDEEAKDEEYGIALSFLMRCLATVYHKQTILLIDDYDVPYQAIESEERFGSIMHAMYSSALKTNRNLAFGVLGGCLRISLLTSGLNHVAIYTVLDDAYCDAFGFTREEVASLFDAQGCHDKTETALAWFGGYRIGGVRLSPPQSVLGYLDMPSYEQPENVGSLLSFSERTRERVALLLRGESIEAQMSEEFFANLVYRGYLTVASGPDEDDAYRLQFPNKKVLASYKVMVKAYLDNHVYQKDLLFLQAFLDRDVQTLETRLAGKLSYLPSVKRWDSDDYQTMVGDLLSLYKGDRFELFALQELNTIALVDKEKTEVYLVSCVMLQEGMKLENIMARLLCLSKADSVVQRYLSTGNGVTITLMGFLDRYVKVLVERIAL